MRLGSGAEPESQLRVVTPLDLYIGIGLGFLGSLHCLQMCGPIVISYSLTLGQASRSRQLAAHLAYNSGRALTYALLGGIAGSLGSAISRLAGYRSAAAIAAGSLMIFAGVLMSGLVSSSGLVRISPFRAGSTLSRCVSRVMTTPTPLSKLSLGLLLGFLPCGLVYGALLKAVETASVLGGALTMLAFGAGTSSALLAIGLFASTFGRWFGRRSHLIAALAIILMGIFLLLRGLSAGGHAHH